MNDKYESQFVKERKLAFDRRRALISFAGGFVGWGVWGAIVVAPVYIFLRPTSQHAALQFLIWLTGLLLLALFTATGKYLATKWFASSKDAQRDKDR